MHNRLPPGATSRELGWREGAVIAPLTACIVAIALYPALILDRGEASVSRSVASVAVTDCSEGALTADALAVVVDEECLDRYGLGPEADRTAAADEGAEAE